MGQLSRQVRRAGANGVVNYNEASRVAARTGVTVDQVYSKANNQGFIAKAGSAAASAGYTPAPGVMVSSGYVNNPNTQKLNAPALDDGVGGQPVSAPEFDWDAWNAEIMARQAAIWESMDAMNADFLRQQFQWQQGQSQGARPQGPQLSAAPDGAKVRRNKKAKSSSASSTNTSIGSSSSGGVSLGGSKNASNGLSIGKA